MGDTKRTVVQGDGKPNAQRPEVGSRWRLERDERLVRARREAKRQQRAERVSARRDDEPELMLGSRTVIL